MKATATKQTALTTYPFGKARLVQHSSDEQTFSELTPTPMIEEEIAPPLAVWERIASVLDEQDRQKHLLNKQPTFQTTKSKVSRKPIGGVQRMFQA